MKKKATDIACCCVPAKVEMSNPKPNIAIRKSPKKAYNTHKLPL